MRELRKSLAIFLFGFTVLVGTATALSYGEGVITFGPKETKIIGSIPYTVIGKYIAQFSAFKGRITLDEKAYQIQSVYLEIEASSIESNCPWCDRVARSRRLLYTAQYPNIIFKSDQIIHDANGYRVKGVLGMHGVKRRMAFPFQVEIIIDQRTKRKELDFKGTWSINRKEFNIIWNKYLDQGGIIVGDHLKVDWGIKVYI